MRPSYRQEVVGLLVVAAGLLCLLSLISYDPLDPSFSTVSTSGSVQNWAGRIGAAVADLLFLTFGASAYVLILGCLAWGGASVWLEEPPLARRRRLVVGLLLWLAAGSAALAFYGSGVPTRSGLVLPEHPGGLLGLGLISGLTWSVGHLGTHLIVWVGLLCALLLTTPFSLRELGGGVWRGLIRLPWRRLTRLRWWPLSTSPLVPRLIRLRRRGKRKDRPRIVELSPPVPQPRQEPLSFMETRPETAYQLPPLSLLDGSPAKSGGTSMTREALEASARLLSQKLRDYGIEGEVTQVYPGPVVTMYEFELAPGVKVSRVVGMADDLCVAMKTPGVRVVAPIPGKSAIGIEIPAPVRQDVFLKEILASETFEEKTAKLPLALGKDIFGQPVVADLTTMPHLLVAGATGSGKSMGLNAWIVSILYTATPDEVRFVFLDPKMLELTVYDGIPHLLMPVITDPKEAREALSRMVAEMQRRYKLLAELGVRSIETYHQALKERHVSSGEPSPHSPLPYIIVVMDDLADLMMLAPREVEESIARLAQMARAAGIHLILTTQRPSVDVLTGTIKANFPARISFQVSSKIDSRTIIDAAGAEQLLGRGDMLYLSPRTGRLLRVHGGAVSDVEVRAVADFWRQQGRPPSGDLPVLVVPEGVEETVGVARDEVYQRAVELVITTGQASASFIQRRLRVGYPRAARMVELMEEDGIVGPAAGAKPREVLTRRRSPMEGEFQ